MIKESEIMKEGQKYFRQNKNRIIDPNNPGAFGYISPRVSSEFMDCSMPMTFDHFSHCSLGCLYCFAYFFKSMNSSFNEKLHAANYKNLIRILRGDKDIISGGRGKMLWDNFIKKKFLLHWGGMADPFCNFEKANPIGYEIIKSLGELNYPCLFSFKGSAVFRPKYRAIFEKYAEQRNFAFQVSIISPSDEMSRKVEIGVPVTSRRIDAIKMLSEMGYFTILRLRPYIIGITDDGIEDLLGRCLEAGIQGVSMEFFAVDSRTSEGMAKRYDWLAQQIGVKDLHQYFKTLSPPERGGYKRLNRLVKEQYVKTVYKFCAEHGLVFGCSDPDFKELNTSGSCCAMPDNYPDNKLLQNWTKNQLTYALKEARRLYHTSGRYSKFRFHQVFRPEEDTYLVNRELSWDHPSVSEFSAGVRHRINYLQIAKRVWNDLRSPSNPRNYFHGKMIPLTVDGDGNYVYKYEPSSYEKEWTKEGIDLTR
jgi:DNA repair photolyase